MTPTERDFASIGLTSEEWQAFILGRGRLAVGRIEAARVAVAKLGKYTEKQTRDTAMLDGVLQMIGTRYPHLWAKDLTLTHEEKVRYLQVEHGWSREQAEQQLQQVKEDNELVDRIQKGTNG